MEPQEDALPEVPERLRHHMKRYEDKCAAVAVSKLHGELAERVYKHEYAYLLSLFSNTELSWAEIAKKLGLEEMTASVKASLQSVQRKYFPDLPQRRSPTLTKNREAKRVEREYALEQNVLVASFAKFCEEHNLTFSVTKEWFRNVYVEGKLCSLHVSTSTVRRNGIMRYVRCSLPPSEFEGEFALYLLEINEPDIQLSDFVCLPLKEIRKKIRGRVVYIPLTPSMCPDRNLPRQLNTESYRGEKGIALLRASAQKEG